jgi:hypothetical protein
VRYYHKAQKCVSPKDHVILRGQVHDLEVELLLSIVLAISKIDTECYLTQWVVGN